MMQNQDLLQHLQELVVIHAGSQMIYPLVMTNIAIEHGPVKIVDLPINSMVIFHSYVNVYQRVGFRIWFLTQGPSFFSDG